MADKATRPVSGSSLSARHHHLTLRDEVDRLFESFFPPAFGRSLLDLDPGSGRAFRSLGDFGPAIDVKDCTDPSECAAESPIEAKRGPMTERAIATFRRLFLTVVVTRNDDGDQSDQTGDSKKH
jgi:hypothetical protein